MELNAPKPAAIHGEIIITVEELERRKDRFRKATKEYYEQAERGFRSLHGFCSRRSDVGRYNRNANENANASANHNETEPLSRKRTRILSAEASGERMMMMLPLGNKNNSSLKRFRHRRRRDQSRHEVPELEADLAQNLLESHFAVVELASEEYLYSIRNLVRLAPSTILPLRQLQFEDQQGHSLAVATATFLVEGEGFLVKVPSSLSSVPLPIAAFDDANSNSSQSQSGGKSLQSRLHKHVSEATEEQHVAMASLMAAVKESKITEELAKTIYERIESILVALRNVSLWIQANKGNTFYCYHYDCNCFRSESDSNSEATQYTYKTPSASVQQLVRRQKYGASGGCGASWDRRVVEALKLDGYYRWFRENNGVLLIGNENDRDVHKSNATLKSKKGCDKLLQQQQGMSGGGRVANRKAAKRFRREIIMSSCYNTNEYSLVIGDGESIY